MHQENYKRSIDRSQGTQLMSEGSAYKKLFSVKEVCEMTGLNRKKLFDYQDMVPPSDYDKSGYKLYDFKAISDLTVIAELRRTGARLARIREAINGTISKEELLAEQIVVLKEQKESIENMIRKAERLLMR